MPPLFTTSALDKGSGVAVVLVLVIAGVHVVVIVVAVNSTSSTCKVVPLITVYRQLGRIVDKQTVLDDNGKPGFFRFLVGRTRHGPTRFHGLVAPEFLPSQCHRGVPANKQRPTFRSRILDPLFQCCR